MQRFFLYDISTLYVIETGDFVIGSACKNFGKHFSPLEDIELTKSTETVRVILKLFFTLRLGVVKRKRAALWLWTAGSDGIMEAITEKMRELARMKEEQLLQQARDSDTMSTIVTPASLESDQLKRSDSISIRYTERVLARSEADKLWLKTMTSSYTFSFCRLNRGPNSRNFFRLNFL